MQSLYPMNDDDDQLEFLPVGTLLVCRGEGPLSKWIRWAEQLPGEEPSWANHVSVVIKPGFLRPTEWGKVPLAWISESMWHIEEQEFWKAHGKETGYRAMAYLPPKLTTAQQKLIVKDLHSRIGQKYGWWRLFTFLGEKLTYGLIPFTRLHKQKGRIVCSNHVCLAYEAAGIKMPEFCGSMDPDDFDDYVTANWTYLGFFAAD